MDWSEGYVTDVEYTRGYYRELNPLLQAFAVATSGGTAPDIERPFVKVELGCGYGLSLLLEAAVFPHARFYGLDFNPRHIAWATRIAADAKLDNITFFDASFADLSNLPIPPADFVGLHGVWTWVNQDNRDIILRWLKHALTDHGVIMVSYNGLGGWAEMRGLRDLMMCKYRSLGGPVEARIRAALELAQNMAKLGSALFTQNPALFKAVEDLAKLPPRYLAHEYFNENWHLFNHHDVATSMAEAGAAFMASCKPVENFEALYLPPNAPAMLDQLTGSDRETVKDIYLRKTFRYDVYMRNAEKRARVEHIDDLKDCRIILHAAHNDALAAGAIKTSVGTIQLPDALWQPIYARLQQGPASGAELAASLGSAQIHAAQIAEIMSVLIEGDMASVALNPTPNPSRNAGAQRLNDVLVQRFLRGDDVPYLVSPVTGLAHKASDMDRLFVRAVNSGGDVIALTADALQRLGRRLKRGGKAVDTAEGIADEVSRMYQAFQQNAAPLYRRLGILK